MNATAAKVTAAAAHPCACDGFVAVDAAGRETRTACTATTKRTFAPGHDARLKGFLIRAGVQGLHIRTPWGGSEQSPQAVADRFGFGHMVAAGIKAAQDRAFAKAVRGVTKTAPKMEAPKPVMAKVGRWVYEGVVLAAGDGTPVFRYTNKQGVSVDAMKFARV